MHEIWFPTLLSVFLVSMVSLVGIALLYIQEKRLKNFLLYMVSFSAGALLGDAFIHLLPDIVKDFGWSLGVSLSLLMGIVFSFIMEKVIHWRHCHIPASEDHPHAYAVMNLLGDGVHNFLDGVIIASSYLLSLHVGIATTIAVVFHEIPQELGDFGVLLQGGFSKGKALFYNFMTALTALLGAALTLLANAFIGNFIPFLAPFAAGGFIYIAAADLIPELHKEVKVQKSVVQVLFFILGVGVMVALLGL